MKLSNHIGTTVHGDLQGWVDDRIAAWCELNGVEDRTPFTFDRVRIATTLAWLEDMGAAGTVLEMGGRGLAGDIIAQRLPNLRMANTVFDLRQQTWPIPDESQDLVLSMEVIEHVCDLSYAYATTLSGVRHVLGETLRVLKPGGRVLLTTPNAASTWIVQRALLQQPPWLYEYHFREFTLEEMRGLCEAAGFVVQRATTEQVWHFWDFRPIEEFMAAAGYSLENRGDDLFLLLSKPS